MAAQQLRAVSDVSDQRRIAIRLAVKGAADKLCRLIASGQSVNTVSHDGLTLLHYAAGHGRTSTVGRLLQCGAEKAVVADAFGTPLHQAAVKGHQGTVRAMLRAGCPVDVKAKKGASVLHFAAAGGDVGVVRLVRGAGCDLNAKDEDGETPLHWAARNAKTEASVELIRSGAKKAVLAGVLGTPLHQAAAKGHRLTVTALLAEGCPVEVLTHCHASVLHYAAVGGDVAVVKEVLGAGCNVNATDKYGMTPLHWAARSGKTEVALELIRRGGERGVVAGKCGVPLHQAAMCGNQSTLRALLGVGCPVDVVDVDGSSVLHFAAFEGQVRVIQFLVEMGLDVRQRDSYGLTALHYTVLFGHLESVNALLQLGANPAVESPMFGTALNLAQICGRREIEDALASVAEERQQPLCDSILHFCESGEAKESVAFLSEGDRGISQFELALFVAIEDNRLRKTSNLTTILSSLSKQRQVDLNRIACLAAIHGDVAILEQLASDTSTLGTYTKPMCVFSLLEKFFPQLKNSKGILGDVIPPGCAMNPLPLAIASLMCAKQRRYHIFMQQSSRNHIEAIRTLATSPAFCDSLNEHLPNGLTPLDLAERLQLSEVVTVIKRAGGRPGIWANLPAEVQQYTFALCQAVTSLRSCGEAGEQALWKTLELTGCVCSSDLLQVTTSKQGVDGLHQHWVLNQRPDVSIIVKAVLSKVTLESWEEVGIMLQVPRSILEELGRNHSHPRSRYRKVLCHWLDWDPAASWRSLLEALGYTETKHTVDELTRNILQMNVSTSNTRVNIGPLV